MLERWLATLTPRERQIVELICEGRATTNPEIARTLCLSVQTVNTYTKNILRALGARNRTELAVAYWRRKTAPPR